MKMYHALINSSRVLSTTYCAACNNVVICAAVGSSLSLAFPLAFHIMMLGEREEEKMQYMTVFYEIFIKYCAHI